jgi:nitrogen-specific signal transduction histidine kinase
VLDNLPDAVLMIESDKKLSYCNQQADSFFKVTLSTLVDNKDTLNAAQYLIMDNRCFHEL